MYNKDNSSEESSTASEIFEDLTPKNNVDENGQYLNALSWALENNNIRNIALTGPYGSGKSSILKTFHAKNSGVYKFLNISLASFKEGEEKNENVLEKGILQQMIYKVPNKTLPYSRFKRIRNEKRISTYVKVISLISFIVIAMQLFFPKILEDLYNKTFIKEIFSKGSISSIVITSIVLIIFFAYSINLITRLSSFFGRNLKFSKLTTPNVTIEVDNNSESSIFDKYLDEIIYFFEATQYQVVIFEDLDRFNNLEIFERLRGLNTLINNAEQIKRRVVFLYAIKDDMFGSEDDMFNSRNRTKFFDFIIPVIPVINSSNSYQILKNKLKASSGAEAITDDFLNDITFYIDDMRILINICNEYNLYKGILGKIDLIANNLLAMIVYKNIYPKDFSDLQFNEGMVYEVFQNKVSYLESRRNALERECFQTEKDINKAEKELLSDIQELDIVYAEALGLNNNNNNNQIILDGQQYVWSNWRGSRFFENLEKAKGIRYYTHTSGWRSPNPTRDQIATVFETKENYFERLKAIKIKEKNQVDKLKQKLEVLNREKQELMAWSIREIIESDNTEQIFNGEIREKKLLIYLIRNGYIDEMYSQYMNYFYPGSLTNEDMKFIMCVKDQEPLPFNYSLSNVNKIVEKLHGSDFKRPEILNYDLIEFLIANNSRYALFLDAVIEQLVNQNKVSLSFIDSFKQNTKFEGIFIKMLGKRWPNMWSCIQFESNYSTNKRDEYLEDIIRFVDIEDILVMDIQGVLSQYISDKNNFFELFRDIEDIKEKVQQLLKQLNVKFTGLVQPIPYSVLDFIHENNLYYINEEMVKLIVDTKIGEETLLNYTNLTKTNLQPLVEYVNEHINEYIERIFLELEENNESEQTIIDLINRDDIKTDLKIMIIERFEGKLESITSVSTALWKQFIRENKVISTWGNLLHYYSEFKMLDNTVIEFLNIESNSLELSRKNIEEITGFGEQLVEELSSELTQCTEIQENCFEIFASSLISWSSLTIEELPINRVKVLIESNILSLSNENYTSLKENFEPLHLMLAEKHVEKLIEDLDSFNIDSRDLIGLIESDQINDLVKENLINNFNVELISQDFGLSLFLTKFIIAHRSQVKESLIKVILDTRISIPEKIGLLSCQIKYLDNEQISNYLQRLDSPYSEIAENGRRPVLEDNNINRSLLNELNEIEYISSWKEENEKLRVNTKHK